MKAYGKRHLASSICDVRGPSLQWLFVFIPFGDLPQDDITADLSRPRSRQHGHDHCVPHLTMERMIGRTFYKRLRLLNGRSETVTTRFELDEATGQLVEHITMQTHDARWQAIAGHAARAPRRSSR